MYICIFFRNWDWDWDLPFWEEWLESFGIHFKSLIYCWWLNSCTTWDVWNPINNGKNYQPQLVSRISAINSIMLATWCNIYGQKPYHILKDLCGLRQEPALPQIHCRFGVQRGSVRLKYICSGNSLWRNRRIDIGGQTSSPLSQWSPFKPHSRPEGWLFFFLRSLWTYLLFQLRKDILMYTFQDEVLLDKFGSIAWSPLIDLPPKKRSILVNYCTFTLVATIYFVAFSDEASLK